MADTVREILEDFFFAASVSTFFLLRAAGAPVPAVLVCKMCGSCFSAQEHLDRHLRHSHASRPQGKHSCSYCPYTSNARVNVLAHERKHTGEKPFVCPVCKKRFTWKGSLAQHQYVHSDEKPFECAECGLRFPRVASLLRHRSLVHLKTGKPYACRHCGQCYRDKQNLRHHVKIHTGERPRACRFCGRNFLLLDSLREHERLVHGRQNTTGHMASATEQE